MSSLVHRTVMMLRSVIRTLRTDRERVSPLEKLVRAALMVPVFGLLLIILRVRATLGHGMDVVVDASTGDRFRCRPPDFIQMYLWIFGEWEPDLTAYIRDSLKPGDVFIDVGANIGYFTALAARRVGPAGKVVAIEASPAVFRSLAETLELNRLGDSVRSVNNAAAAAPATIVLYCGPSKNIGLTTTVESRGFRRESEIEALPIDDLLSSTELRAARLVKIDVEGAEPEVLRGMQRFLDESRDDAEILVELSPLWWEDQTRRPIDVLQPLFNAGFQAYEIENNYWPWRYLWPNCTRRPRRSTRDFTKRVKRIDLVLARADGEQL